MLNSRMSAALATLAAIAASSGMALSTGVGGGATPFSQVSTPTVKGMGFNTLVGGAQTLRGALAARLGFGDSRRGRALRGKRYSASVRQHQRNARKARNKAAARR